MENLNDIKFYFPTNILQKEDFFPIEVLILKDYYRNNALQLLDKVIYIILLLYILIYR